MRDLLGKLLLCIGATFLFGEVEGQNSVTFIAKNRVAIERYVMSGYGNGWKHCEILSENLQVWTAIQ